MSSRREMQQLVRELESAGFKVTRTGSGHWKVMSRTGMGHVIMGFSPNSAGLQKTLTRLKKIGFTR